MSKTEFDRGFTTICCVILFILHIIFYHIISIKSRHFVNFVLYFVNFTNYDELFEWQRHFIIVLKIKALAKTAFSFTNNFYIYALVL